MPRLRLASIWFGLSMLFPQENLANDLDPQQIKIIQDTAASICNTVSQAKGTKTTAELQGEVTAKLRGVVGNFVDLGTSGQGSISVDEFEGLTRDATAEAFKGDQGCRERVFNKMFDRLSDASNSFAVTNNSNLGESLKKFNQSCGDVYYKQASQRAFQQTEFRCDLSGNNGCTVEEYRQYWTDHYNKNDSSVTIFNVSDIGEWKQDVYFDYDNKQLGLIHLACRVGKCIVESTKYGSDVPHPAWASSSIRPPPPVLGSPRSERLAKVSFAFNDPSCVSTLVNLIGPAG